MSAYNKQEGGDHYNSMVIQPATYILANNIPWAEGCAIAYLSRWRQKGGVQDLRKAIHTIELLIEDVEMQQKQPSDDAIYGCPMQEQRLQKLTLDIIRQSKEKGQ